jgi:uncharacterized protein YbcI
MEVSQLKVGVERAISRRMVAVYKEHVGRGPVNARTVINDEMVVVVLRETLTKAERTLAEDEREELVIELRRTFQGTMRDAMVAAVEEELGREVSAFLSDQSVHPDIAVEVFILGDGQAGAAGSSDGEGSQSGFEPPP